MPDDLNYSAMRFYWDVLQSLLLAALFVWTLIDKKRQQNSQGISDLEKRMTDINRRVQKLEDTQALLPTHQDLTKIQVQVAGLTKQIEGVDTKLETIHQFLLNNSNQKG